MRIDIEQLSNNAHVWIFGVSPALDAERGSVLLRHIDAFLDQWASHGTPIRAARELREGSFLVIAADEASERSGCSIDKMFGLLRQLERELNVQILDSNRVFLRDGESVRALPRGEFRNAASASTVVFDVLAEQLGAVRSGTWEKPAEQSWHRHLLG